MRVCLGFLNLVAAASVSLGGSLVGEIGMNILKIKDRKGTCSKTRNRRQSLHVLKSLPNLKEIILLRSCSWKAHVSCL